MLKASRTLGISYLELEAHPDCTKLMILAATLQRGIDDGEYMLSQKK